MSDAECRERAADLEEKLATVRERERRLSAEVETLQRERDNLVQISRLFESEPEETIQRARTVGKEARDAVLFLDLGGGLGTGWYVDDHHIVTNAHNVAAGPGQTREVTAWTFGGEEYETTLVDYVETNNPDLAVLRTDERAPATLPTGRSPSRGDEMALVQVGHPGGIGNWMISLGKMWNTYRSQTPDGEWFTQLETTVPGRPGVSGSPLLNLDGEVVGLTNSGLPISSRPEGKPPLVADPVVYDRPIASLSKGGHVGIDVVMDYYGRWTQ